MTAAASLTPEERLAAFALEASWTDVPEAPRTIIRQVLLAVLGTAIAGAGEEGIAPLRALLAERGGKAEATALVFGDRLPAPSAALLNATMARALDFCDAMAPGIHIGSSLVPVALSAAEMRGGCGGTELLSALAAGCEIGARMNLSETGYDGLDPTGVAAVYPAAAVAARLLGLTREQTLHALALAFNRSSGSFQSNVDGSLAVRLNQGFAAEAGLTCALLAARGLTGPRRFLSGIYGYARLYGKGERTAEEIVAGLGKRFDLTRMMFKKFPSCGVTQGATDLTLRLMAEHGLTAADIETGEVRLPPYAHRLVGHPFRIGSNPKVDAQFSVRYCVANALVRGTSKLEHFTVEAVGDPRIAALAARIDAIADPGMDPRGHCSVDVSLTTAAGRIVKAGYDIARGYPGNALSPAEHRARFDDCMDYARHKLPAASRAAIPRLVAELEALPDVRELVRLTIAEAA